MQTNLTACSSRPRDGTTRLIHFKTIGLLLVLLSDALHAQATKPIANLPATESSAGPDPSAAIRLSAVVVTTERSDSLVGIAGSASQGYIGAEQLKHRPIVRAGEVLETVPGLIVSQHSGEGKANQYYLRGFNLDHGTDFLTEVEGMPVNLVTHAHGQGWSDTGFLIPELVRTIRYQKGVYFAENGDLSSAGAANIQYFNTLPQSFAQFETGSFDYHRTLLAASTTLASGNLLYAVEANYNNGPFQRGDHYRKGNAVFRYSQERRGDGWSVTLMGYKAKWDATDQIPLRAVVAGSLDRFGLIDASDGGDSERYSLTAEWHRQNATSATKVTAYGFYYSMDLYSNFTYFLSDPVRGDQFEQPDQRFVAGFKASHSFVHRLGETETTTTFGLQNRTDFISNGLFLTQRRERHATVREDDTAQISLSPYAENKTKWNEWLRSTVGLRFDAFQFEVDSDLPGNTGKRRATILSPKGGIVLGPWAQTEIYLNGGLGFHSNDARGANTRFDPNTGDPVERAAPLVRTTGAEAGVRTTWMHGLQSTLAFWWLDSDSELIFVGDAGTTEAGRPSRRYGIEFANYYSPTKWLTFDADVSLSKSRFRDRAPEGDSIPGSIESVVAAGMMVHDLKGFSGGLRLRYFGPRPLIEDDSVRSRETVLVSGHLGYEFSQRWALSLDVFNVLNRKDSAIDYYYPSRLAGEPPGPDDGGYNDKHFHPTEPISFRVALTARF